MLTFLFAIGHTTFIILVFPHAQHVKRCLMWWMCAFFVARGLFPCVIQDLPNYNAQRMWKDQRNSIWDRRSKGVLEALTHWFAVQ